MKKLVFFVVVAVFVLTEVQSQSCTAITFDVDLSASTDTTVVFQSNRNGDCCGGTNCIRFNLTLNPACSYVNFNVENPAPPGNAAYYQVNCGPQTSLGTPICIVGLSTVSITFCKPGNDNPIYTITAAGALQGSPDITVREGCSASMSVSGLTLATINWTSIYPGVQGAYDSYLSCTSACDNTTVTPMPGAPSYIDYRVGGNRLCGSVVYDTIRVYTVPQIAVSVTPNNLTICSGSSTTLTATASGGDAPYNYVWSNGQTGQSITVNTAGVYTVSVTDTRNCIPAVQSATINVATTPPAPTASSNSAVCAGSTLNLFASSIAGATYNWTGPNGFTSSLQNPVINNASIANEGTYTVTATVGQCTSTSSTTNVIINPNPLPPAVSGNSPVCESSTLNLSASLIPGATYNWTGPNGFNSTNQNISINNVGMANAGIYAVTATVNGCTSTVSSINAVVKSLPSAPIVSTNSPICDGSSLNLSASSLSGASYMWTGPNGFSSSTQNPILSNVGTNASGIYSVTATINGCAGPAGSASVIVNPVPPAPYVTSNGPLCAGSTLNLSASNIAGATYSWTGPNGFTSSLQNPTIASVTTAAAGTYNTTVTVNGCTSAAGSASVVVNAIPATPAPTNNGPLCVGTTLNLNTAAVPGATYSWTGSNGFTSSLQNPTIAGVTTAAAGTYNATVTVNGCTSAAGSTTVVVNTIPATPAPTNNGPLCAGTTLNLNTAAVPGATYSWTGTSGFTSSVQNPTIAGVTTTAAGTYNVTVTVNGCTSAAGSTTVVVNTIPAAPTPTNNGPICVGATLSLNTAAVAGASYSWIGPNSFTSTAQNPSIAGVTTAAAGTYNTTVTVNGCTSATGSTTVVVNTIPVTPTPTSNGPLCVGATLNLSTAAIAGATYSWTGPNGFNSSTQSPILSNAGTNASGIYSVTTTINGCTGSAGSTSVVVNPIPPAPYIISNGPLCAGSTLNLSASNIAGASYAWTGPNNFISSVQNNSLNAVGVVNAGTYTVKAIVNGCSSTTSSTVIVINQPATANAGANQAVCSSNQFVNLSATVSGGSNSGTWTTSGEGYFSDNSNLSARYYPSASDKLAGQVMLNLVSSNNGACTASSSSLMIKFSAAPSVNAGNNQTVCANSSPVALSGQYTNSNGIIWSTSGTGTFSPSRYDVNATYTPSSLDKTYGRINLVLKTTGTAPCVDASDTLLLTLKTAPEIKTSSTKYVLENNSIVLDPAVSGSNVRYSWFPGVFLNNDTIVNPVCTPKADIKYNLVATDDFGCTSSADVLVKLLKLPEIPNVFTPNGDGINETWQIKYLKDYPECTVEIFNRYGQLLYHSAGYSKEWDGTLNGKPLPAGTFYYIINLKITTKPLSGFVDIVR